jgi:hypothetical protein
LAIGSVKTPVDVGRLLAYVATSAASGIVGPPDLEVRELDTPGTSIQVMPGACVIASGYPAAGQQSYAARNPDPDVEPVTATGSGSGRSDLVVARVRDDEYAGVDKPGIETFIVKDVDPGTTTVKEAVADGATGLEAAIELARLDIPASTGTITQAMIADLRRIAVPLRDILTPHVVAADSRTTDEVLSSSGYQVWPSVLPWQVRVPDWANRCQVTITLAGVKAEGSSGDTAQGDLHAYVDDDFGYSPGILYNNTITGSFDTYTYQAATEVMLKAAQRGATVEIGLKGRHTAGAGHIKWSWGTNAVMQVTFRQAAAGLLQWEA